MSEIIYRMLVFCVCFYFHFTQNKIKFVESLKSLRTDSATKIIINRKCVIPPETWNQSTHINQLFDLLLEGNPQNISSLYEVLLVYIYKLLQNIIVYVVQCIINYRMLWHLHLNVICEEQSQRTESFLRQRVRYTFVYFLNRFLLFTSRHVLTMGLRSVME